LRSTSAHRHTLAVLAVACALLSGCEVFKKNDETALIVNNRALGMPAGEFFDRYGRPQRREETSNGAIEYVWVSAVLSTQGRADVDDQLCGLRLSADNRGRITAAQVMYDGQGKNRISRCAEIFAAP
jgi:hypothetical protein